jgi:hypothetical protein
MKIILTSLIILSLVLVSFTPYSQNPTTNAPIASVEYLDKQPPVEKKANKKKKRRRNRKNYQLRQQKKQQDNNNKEKLPITFFILAGLLFIGFVAWAIYFFPLLASGSLAASAGCLAPVITFILGFLGIFFSLIILAGVVIFTIFAIIILNRNNLKKSGKANSASSGREAIETDDFAKLQIYDKAYKELPNLAPETLDKYVNTKDSIVELKYERSKLDATEAQGRMKDKIEGKINSIDRRITEKELVLSAIEKSHADLEKLPEDKRVPYINIKIKLAKLKAKQTRYQQEDDLRSIGKLRDIEKDIQAQEEELKLLLGVRID